MANYVYLYEQGTPKSICRGEVLADFPQAVIDAVCSNPERFTYACYLIPYGDRYVDKETGDLIQIHTKECEVSYLQWMKDQGNK